MTAARAPSEMVVRNSGLVDVHNSKLALGVKIEQLVREFREEHGLWSADIKIDCGPTGVYVRVTL